MKTLPFLDLGGKPRLYVCYLCHVVGGAFLPPYVHNPIGGAEMGSPPPPQQLPKKVVLSLTSEEEIQGEEEEEGEK